ncbi:MAG: HAD hydrolase-like protein [Nanoarchaeota archaeon]|nr:HAD hydrolase-like protein [Nanoarchaeota archaeon]MBU1854099.1 HAD hydrolase-like protein [Nanoarchaeota archaeon]
MSIKAVIFDIGGVCYLGRMKSAFKELSKELNSKDVINIYHQNEEKLLKGELEIKDFCMLVSKKVKMNHNDIHKTIIKVWKNYFIPNKELLIIIHKLSKKYKIACLSNATKFDTELDKITGFDKIFNPYINSCDYGLVKSNKEFLLLVLKKLNLKASECVIIDDYELNVKVSESLGFKAIHFKNNIQLEENLISLGLKFS